jgi:hypothetical protein
MSKLLLLAVGTTLAVIGAIVLAGSGSANAVQRGERSVWHPGFQVDVLVNGRPLEEYHARGKVYVEALQGAEYELRVHNPSSYRVAVALSVDGLNTIDARRTSAWNASKWVIEPHGTIHIAGWQMSTQRARRFYFTSEQDSYGAKLGQTANLGVISAVFFRERRTVPVPITPAPRDRPIYDEDYQPRERSDAPSAGTGELSAKQRQGTIRPAPDDDYAATGIGRSVHNDVRWVNMDLDSRATGQVTIRYEYYPALVRLGILPRRYSRPDVLSNRERSSGFEDRRFSPEP